MSPRTKGKSSKKSKNTNCDEDEIDCSFSVDAASRVDLTTSIIQLVSRVSELLSRNADLQDEVRGMKYDIKELKDSNQSLIQRLEILESKSGEWSTQQSAPQKHLSAPVQDVMALTTKVADEMLARKEKETNLVIVGLPEDAVEKDDPQDPAGNDACRNNVCSLLQSIGVENPWMTRVFRMGKRQPDRPRPVKVICDGSETRKLALENAKKLKNLHDSHPNKKVYIRQDLTQLQRDHEYHKRQSRYNHHSSHSGTAAVHSRGATTSSPTPGHSREAT